MKRFASVLVALILTMSLIATASSSHEHSSHEQGFVDRINHERASRGMNELSISSDLVSVAREHSAEMANNDDLYHNDNLANEVSGWKKVGENVGRGPGVDSIHNAFMDSGAHRINILDPDWEEVGVGVVVVDGQMWVTELFRDPKQTPAPEPEAGPEPDVEPGEHPDPGVHTHSPRAPPPGEDSVYTKLYYMLKKLERLELNTGLTFPPGDDTIIMPD